MLVFPVVEWTISEIQARLTNQMKTVEVAATLETVACTTNEVHMCNQNRQESH